MESVIDNPNAIAIIGMSARFPGAATLEEFWQNLINGVESVSFFSDQELREAGVPEELIQESHYVPAASLLDGIEKFDARFFGFTPREAELTDPQHRLFLEVAWEAMETAGYGGDNSDVAVGVFAGAGPTACSYLGSDTHASPKLLGPAGSREHIGNDKDYLTTRVSYRLNLRGPSVCVQTACSTSLVAVHLACQSLLMGESDMALAGGVTVRVPQRKGYTARDNAICSPDGHCRAFDAAAEGTVFGSGVGAVVLKRLARAVEDGDTIRAVIGATAVNNDGGDKISYWASSVDGQIAALSEAIAVAGVEPASIGFVEAHGTGTTMGDPIEVMALTQTFRAGSEENGYCALGSVKTNVGHLDSAAGIVSLIKAILTLERKTIPPTLHFNTPNPRIKFEATPFFVNTDSIRWEPQTGPRRALVNALGIGGTNACAVLEESPQVGAEDRVATAQPFCVLPLSAKNAKALEELVERYLSYLDQPHPADLIDICFTASVGRRHFDHRLACVAATHDDLRTQLAMFSSEEPNLHLAKGKTPRGGAAKLGLLFLDDTNRSIPVSLEKLRTFPAVAAALDACDAVVRARTGNGLPPSLSGWEEDSVQGRLCSRLEAFVLDYALAQQWIAWTGSPAVVAGLGDGEVTAACVAELISLDTAIKMLADDQRHWSSSQLPAELGSASCCAWSVGSACDLEQAWAANRTPDQLRELPSDLNTTLKSSLTNLTALVQLGAGASSWATNANEPDGGELPLISAAQECPCQRLIETLARAYVLGADIDWASVHNGKTRRVLLPTYPFQKKSFWLEPVPLGMDHLPIVPRCAPDAVRRVLLADDPHSFIFECQIPGMASSGVEPKCRELITEAWRSANGKGPVATNDWEFQLPESCSVDSPWLLQLIMRPATDEAFDATVYCREEAGSQPLVWHKLATAKLMPAT